MTLRLTRWAGRGANAMRKCQSLAHMRRACEAARAYLLWPQPTGGVWLNQQRGDGEGCEGTPGGDEISSNLFERNLV